MKNYKIRISKMNISNLFIILFYIAVISWYLLPSIKYTVPPYLIVSLGVIVIVNALMHRRILLETVIRFIFPMVIVMFIYLAFTYPGNIDKAVGILTQQFISFLPLVLLSILTFQKESVVRFIELSCWVMLLYVLMVTSIELIQNERIVRILAFGESSTFDLASYRMRNIGGFGFCYGLPFIIIALSWKLIKQNKNRFLNIIFLLFLMWFLLKAQYFIALAITVISVILLYIGNKKNRKYIIIVLPILIIISIFLPSILLIISSLLKSDSLSSKLIEVANLLRFGGVTGSSTVARIRVYKQSFDAFLSSPIYGVKVGSLGEGNLYAVAGNHSTVFDYLALTGIIGFGAYISLIFYASKALKEFVDTSVSKDTYIITIIMLAYVMLSILNPIMNSYEISIFIFFIAPLIIKKSNPKNKENN